MRTEHHYYYPVPYVPISITETSLLRTSAANCYQRLMSEANFSYYQLLLTTYGRLPMDGTLLTLSLNGGESGYPTIRAIALLA